MIDMGLNRFKMGFKVMIKVKKGFLYELYGGYYTQNTHISYQTNQKISLSLKRKRDKKVTFVSKNTGLYNKKSQKWILSK